MRHTVFIVFFFFFVAFSFAEETVVKRIHRGDDAARNLLQPERFRDYGDGFEKTDEIFFCDNGNDVKAVRGVSQSVTLDQAVPAPIHAEAWSRAEEVSGSPDSDYAVYLDIAYTDGTFLWGQTAPFSTGTHDWEKRSVLVMPEKPVKSLTFYTLFRNKSGRASFRDLKLTVPAPDGDAVLFDGVPVLPLPLPPQGVLPRFSLQLRDVAADSDFFLLQEETLGIKAKIDSREAPFPDRRDGSYLSFGTRATLTLKNTENRDRCLTIVFAVDVSREKSLRVSHPRGAIPLSEYGRREHTGSGTTWPVGVSGRLSRYPIFAVEDPDGQGRAVGIDLARPAFFRTGYNEATRELFVAVDLALTPEVPEAVLGFVEYNFHDGFRDAWKRSGYGAFSADSAFRMGTWMPFHPISKVPGFEDFGFRFKEGIGETGWDDEHDILTFRYTEPMTWWMPLPEGTPRTYEAALDHARKLAGEGNAHARALFVGGMKDADGRFSHRILDTPWCDGVVWSLCDLPGIEGGDFTQKWSPAIREQYYGEEIRKKHEIDGEYVDSAEGYVTAVLDFDRNHFAAAKTPLVFSRDDHKPALFRGLVAFEYVRALAKDVHGMDRLMMANSTPGSLCWLAPLLDVMGTETNWHYGGQWRPMSDEEMLYRRFLCGVKPYCFLMNTNFSEWTFEMSEKFMKRSLAYGMFPGFFSEDASTGHYFSRPELFERDRPLFRKYMPLCRAVAEAGWQPMTQAETSHGKVYIERFGQGEQVYWTVFNDTPEPVTVSLRFQEAGLPSPTLTERLSGEVFEAKTVPGDETVREVTLTLGPEDVRVLESTY